MRYKNIFQFIDKCVGLLKRTPRNEKEHYKVFLFSNLGKAISLEIYAQNYMMPNKSTQLYWILSSTAEGYKLDCCLHCTGENPCVNHQMSSTNPLNMEIIREAKRANEPEIGLSVPIPEPKYPYIEKGFGFNTLADFREATKNIFPIFSEQVGWRFLTPSEGLTWNLEKTEYPRVVGYSPDGRTEYERGFYKFNDSEFILLDRLNELLPKEPGAKLLRPILIRKLLRLQRMYRNSNKIRRDLADKLDTKMRELKLVEERRNLAKKFGVGVKNV